MCQSLAVNIVYLLEGDDMRHIIKPIHDHLDSILDVWMAVEHNELWKNKNEREEMQRRDEESNVELSELEADDMISLLEKMRALSGSSDVE